MSVPCQLICLERLRRRRCVVLRLRVSVDSHPGAVLLPFEARCKIIAYALALPHFHGNLMCPSPDLCWCFCVHVCELFVARFDAILRPGCLALTRLCVRLVDGVGHESHHTKYGSNSTFFIAFVGSTERCVFGAALWLIACGSCWNGGRG